MYSIKCNHSEAYETPITTYLKREFPILLKPNDHALLDLLTEAIVASGQVRFGPKPSPESLVAIRQIISYWTERSKPIPFLMAWGSEKSDGSGVDIAEMFALKTLSCLNHRVQSFYQPGVEFNIRVEDASAPHLFFDRMEQARLEAARYTNGFVNLAKVIGVSDFIHIIPESTITTEENFNKKADEILPHMRNHVADPTSGPTRERLLTYGWKTPLTEETVKWYYDRYEKLYTGKDKHELQDLLARYFAGALARYALNMRGDNPAWQNQYLELSFTAPTPGIAANRALRRIYYRTMPSSITSLHMPAWRAKGYLKINGEVSAALASFNDKGNAYNPNTLVLSDGKIEQTIQADYIVLD